MVIYDDTKFIVLDIFRLFMQFSQKVTIFGNNPFISFLIHTTHPTQQRSHTSASPRSLYTSTSRTFDRWRKMDGNLAHLKKTRWWQLKYVLCSPRTLGKIFTHFDSYVSKGLVKNHQPEKWMPQTVSKNLWCRSNVPVKKKNASMKRTLQIQGHFLVAYHYCQGCNLGYIG